MPEQSAATRATPTVEPIPLPATPAPHTTPKVVGTCPRCQHRCELGITPATMPDWLRTCACDCHKLWRLWHSCPYDDDAPF